MTDIFLELAKVALQDDSSGQIRHSDLCEGTWLWMVNKERYDGQILHVDGCCILPSECELGYNDDYYNPFDGEAPELYDAICNVALKTKYTDFHQILHMVGASVYNLPCMECLKCGFDKWPHVGMCDSCEEQGFPPLGNTVLGYGTWLWIVNKKRVDGQIVYDKEGIIDSDN